MSTSITIHIRIPIPIFTNTSMEILFIRTSIPTHTPTTILINMVTRISTKVTRRTIPIPIPIKVSMDPMSMSTLSIIKNCISMFTDSPVTDGVRTDTDRRLRS